MAYETARLLIYQSYQQWISKEVFSFSWFVMIGMLVIVYGIWLKLMDKSKIHSILLLGCLSAVGFFIADMLFIAYLGVAEYQIRILPWNPPILIVSITIAPIMLMLVYQYTSSWRSYTLWAGIVMAVVSFGLMPLYSLLGIYKLVKWNYVYQFIMMFSDGIIARGLLAFVIGIEKSHLAMNHVSSRPTGILQPVAAKPLDNEKQESKDNNE